MTDNLLELSAKDMYNIASTYPENVSELEEILAKVAKAATLGKFDVNIDKVISDPVLTMLTAKGFEYFDNRAFHSTTDKVFTIYWNSFAKKGED